MIFTEYYCYDLYGGVIFPYFDTKSKIWKMKCRGIEFSTDEIITLCNIPEDEAIILKLKYGNNSAARLPLLHSESDRLWLRYSYKSEFGEETYPFFKNAEWRFYETGFVYTLKEITSLCRIPEDEAILLSLMCE